MSAQKSSSSSSRFGYFISILLSGVIYYVINTIPIWDYIPILTEQFQEVLWIANLSLGVTAFTSVTFMVFDPRWYRSLMQAIMNSFSLFSTWVFRQVFPLDLIGSTAHWVNIGLLILMAAMILSTLAELGTAVRYYRNSIRE